MPRTKLLIVSAVAIATVSCGTGAVLASAASATKAPSTASANASRDPESKQEALVFFTIQHKADYTAAFCFKNGDQAFCIHGIEKGQTRSVSIRAGIGTEVGIVLTGEQNGGADFEKGIVRRNSNVLLRTAGTKAKPDLRASVAGALQGPTA